jgi:hypothetical protein
LLLIWPFKKARGIHPHVRAIYIRKNYKRKAGFTLIHEKICHKKEALPLWLKQTSMLSCKLKNRGEKRERRKHIG